MYGLVCQIREILRRMPACRGGETYRTRSLSRSYFLSSFYAFFAVFMHSALLTPPDFYLVLTRLLAMVLVLTIIIFIAYDRRTLKDAVALGTAGLLLVLGLGLLLLGGRAPFIVGAAGPTNILVVTPIITVGNIRQISLIEKLGEAGAVSMRMHILYLVKDITLCMFAIAMGLAAGWPILFFGICDGTCKAFLIMSLLRHAKPLCINVYETHN